MIVMKNPKGISISAMPTIRYGVQIAIFPMLRKLKSIRSYSSPLFSPDGSLVINAEDFAMPEALTVSEELTSIDSASATDSASDTEKSCIDINNTEIYH